MLKILIIPLLFDFAKIHVVTCPCRSQAPFNEACRMELEAQQEWLRYREIQASGSSLSCCLSAVGDTHATMPSISQASKPSNLPCRAQCSCACQIMEAPSLSCVFGLAAGHLAERHSGTADAPARISAGVAASARRSMGGKSQCWSAATVAAASGSHPQARARHCRQDTALP